MYRRQYMVRFYNRHGAYLVEFHFASSALDAVAMTLGNSSKLHYGRILHSVTDVGSI